MISNCLLTCLDRLACLPSRAKTSPSVCAPKPSSQCSPRTLPGSTTKRTMSACWRSSSLSRRLQCRTPPGFASASFCKCWPTWAWALWSALFTAGPWHLSCAPLCRSWWSAVCTSQSLFVTSPARTKLSWKRLEK